jgi:hypothetical protein
LEQAEVFPALRRLGIPPKLIFFYLSAYLRIYVIYVIYAIYFIYFINLI